MTHPVVKYAAGAVLSLLLFAAIAGVEWLPFASTRQALQDVYHHHMLEQQDVVDYKTLADVSAVQEKIARSVQKAKQWRPNIRGLQGPVILSPEEAPTLDPTDPTAATAAPVPAAGARAVPNVLGPSSDAGIGEVGAAGAAAGGPDSGVSSALGGEGSAEPGAASPEEAAVAASGGCVPVASGGGRGGGDDSSSAGFGEFENGPASGPEASSVPTALGAAPAPDGTSLGTGRLCATGSAGGVYVPNG